MNRIAAAAFLLVVFLGAGFYLENGRVDLDGVPGFDYLQTRLQPVTQKLRNNAEAILGIASADRSGTTSNDGNQYQAGRGPIAGGLEPGEVLVIIASTLSEEAALNHAKRLQDRGHNSEVILSTNGYYGVALGRFSYEQALSMGDVSNQPDVEPASSYIMRTSSIRSYVYP